MLISGCFISTVAIGSVGPEGPNGPDGPETVIIKFIFELCINVIQIWKLISDMYKKKKKVTNFLISKFWLLFS